MFVTLIMYIIEFVYLSLDFLDSRCQINISKAIAKGIGPYRIENNRHIGYRLILDILKFKERKLSNK